MMTTKSLIVLSGGLDSAVTLAKSLKEYNIKLALFFNYGQKALEKERIAAKELCKFFDIEFTEIELPWLKNITTTALVKSDANIPDINTQDLDTVEIATQTKSKVWVPNRNGLFLNIAASYADSYGYDKIFIGANKEEGETFSDNSKDFIEAINKELEYSTQVKPKVVAPLINVNKQEIIELAKSINFPFNLIWSCYSNSNKHCGQCESCKRLKRGLERANLFDIVNLLFDIK